MAATLAAIAAAALPNRECGSLSSLSRSSYRAAEAFLHGVLTGKSEAARADRYGKKKRLSVVE